MVLEIKKLTFGYKKNNFIFENFDLELKKGELKTIFGKSGSGKTTLFELILGNLKQQSGEIKRVYVTVNGSREVIESDQLLVATGRKPNTDSLNLSAAE